MQKIRAKISLIPRPYIQNLNPMRLCLTVIFNEPFVIFFRMVVGVTDIDQDSKKITMRPVLWTGMTDEKEQQARFDALIQPVLEKVYGFSYGDIYYHDKGV